MLSKAHKLTIREQYTSDAAGNRVICRRIARRLMLSISLIALSPEALVTGSGGQLFWTDKAKAFGDDAFSDLSPLGDKALEKQRGGFDVAGLEIDVGVSVSTTIDGFIEVTTNYSLNSEKGLVHLGSEIKNLAKGLTNSMIEEIQSETASAVSQAMEESTGAATAMDPEPAPLALSEHSSYDNDISATGATAPDSSATIASAIPETSRQTPQTESTPTDLPQSDIKSAGPVVSPSETTIVSAPKATPTESNNPATDNPTPAPVTTTAVTVPNIGIADSDTGSQVAGTTVTSAPTRPSATAESVADSEAVAVSEVARTTGSSTQTPSPSTATESTATEGTPPVPVSMAEIIHQTNGEHVTLLTNRLNNANIQQTVTMNITLENFSKIRDIARIQKDITQLTRQISLFSLRH